MTELVKFANAGLPTVNIGSFRAQLQAARDAVSVTGGTPFLRLGKNDGVWSYGQEETEVEDGSLWAVNPLSMATGVIAWPPPKSPLKEPIKKMRAIFDASSPPLNKAQLGEPANGGTWDDCVSFQLQCIGGAGPKGEKIEDIGTVVEYQQNSFGGKQAFDEVAKQMMIQVEANPTLIVPVCSLVTESYQHPKWGTVYKPIFEIVKWVGLDGAEAAPVEEPEAKAEPEAPARRGTRGATGAAEPPKTTEAPAADGVVRRRRRAA